MEIIECRFKEGDFVYIQLKEYYKGGKIKYIMDNHRYIIEFDDGREIEVRDTQIIDKEKFMKIAFPQD